MKKTEWKIGEEGADATVAKNLRVIDYLFQKLETCCANPDCQYPISMLRQERFAVPEVGDVCAVCHAMYTSLSYMNPQLKNSTYFKLAHEKYLNEIKEFQRKRKNMGGLDGL